MDEPWDIHLEAWLAGTLPPDEAQAFLARTQADPVLLTRMGRVLRQQALLAEHLGTARGRPANHRRWWWSAAAALVVLGWWASTGDTPLARVVASSGATPIIEHGGRRTASTVIHSGDTLQVDASSVRLEFLDEATVITCASGTRVRIDADGRGRRIAVLSGRLDADVAPQCSDRPLVFSTPEALVTVVGTRLSVVVAAGATAVAVQHGSVRVTTAQATGGVVLAAGQFAQVDAGRDPVTRPLSAGWDVLQGLIAYWPLDEGIGGVVHDVSGHGHHSRSLTAAWTTGHSGSALSFTGQFGGEWVDFGPQQPGTPAGITVSAWVRTTEPRFGTVFSGGFTVGAGSSTKGIPESEHRGSADAAGYVNFLSQSNRPNERLDSPQRINDDRWHHLAWTWDAGGWRRIWIDGDRAAERQDAAEREHHWDGWIWAIGAEGDRLVWNFPGSIDEVRVYDRALAADEIRSLAGLAPRP